jgi:hypothetical protein
MAPAAPKSSALRNGVVLVALLAGGYGAYHYYQNNGSTVTIGTKDQVIYSGQATKDQATALGNALKTDGYFQDRGVSVLLNKGSSGTAISYVVQDGVWNKPDMVSAFETITRGVAPTVGGLPVDMRLVNTTEVVEKDEVITAQADTTTTPATTNPTPADTTSTVTIGTKDQIIYSGQATQAQATALGNALKQAGYLQDRGVSVLLNIGANGTVISYVVQDGVWNNPAMVTDFETITRGVASTVGGLPIDMRLVNSTEVVEKDEVVQ